MKPSIITTIICLIFTAWAYHNYLQSKESAAWYKTMKQRYEIHKQIKDDPFKPTEGQIEI